MHSRIAKVKKNKKKNLHFERFSLSRSSARCKAIQSHFPQSTSDRIVIEFYSKMECPSRSTRFNRKRNATGRYSCSLPDFRHPRLLQILIFIKSQKKFLVEEWEGKRKKEKRLREWSRKDSQGYLKSRRQAIWRVSPRIFRWTGGTGDGKDYGFEKFSKEKKMKKKV